MFNAVYSCAQKLSMAKLLGLLVAGEDCGGVQLSTGAESSIFYPASATGNNLEEERRLLPVVAAAPLLDNNSAARYSLSLSKRSRIH